MRAVDTFLMVSLLIQLAFGLRLLFGPNRLGWQPRTARLIGGFMVAVALLNLVLNFAHKL